MKICFVLEYYYPHIGGFEILFQHLAEGLVHAGHQCTVVTSRLPGTARREQLNGVDICRVPVPAAGDRYWFTLLGIYPALKTAKDHDVVVTTTYNGTLPAWLAARIRRKPSVIVLLEVVGKNWSRIGLNRALAFFYRLVERLVLSLPFDRYISISLNTMHAPALKGIPPEKMTLAYPGIDYRLFDPKVHEAQRNPLREKLGIERDSFVYTFFGRPGYVKGVEFLVRAAPLIRKRIPNSRLLLILSKKPEEGRRRVEEMIAATGMKKGADIIVLDPVPREMLPGYLMASDCVVVPSLSEGFGFTCVEACTMGLPVVASAVASLPEVVFGKYVLAASGEPAAIADGVHKVFRGEYSVSEKKEFRWEKMVGKHLEVYSSLLRDPGRRTDPGCS